METQCLRVYVAVHKHAGREHLRALVCMCVGGFVCMCACVCVCVCCSCGYVETRCLRVYVAVHKHAGREHLRAPVCMCVCGFLCVYVCVCMCVYSWQISELNRKLKIVDRSLTPSHAK